MDLLADVLAVAGVRGTIGARIDAVAPWAVQCVAAPRATFYAVSNGTAWLRLPDRKPVELAPGDVVLLPTGTAHVLASGPDVLVNTSCDHQRVEPGNVLRFGRGEADELTHVLGANYAYDPAISVQVLASLPEVAHVPAEQDTVGLHDTVELLCRELRAPQLATAVVLDRLVDVLLVQLLRVWLATHPESTHGSWLGVLADPLVSDAMGRLHQQPDRAWTTELLAAELAVSRTTLARRFRAVAGETPGGYLTRWRMDLAAVRLRDTDDTLESIARAVGYTSVYAFSRAFRRARGQAPGRYRVLARHAEPVMRSAG